MTASIEPLSAWQNSTAPVQAGPRCGRACIYSLFILFEANAHRRVTTLMSADGTLHHHRDHDAGSAFAAQLAPLRLSGHGLCLTVAIYLAHRLCSGGVHEACDSARPAALRMRTVSAGDEEAVMTDEQPWHIPRTSKHDGAH